MTKARDLADRTAADITAVTAGTGISISSGTGPIPTVTNTVATGFDAKGDLIVGTGADTFTTLTVGSTAGHVLTVDSATTSGLKWAAASGGSSGISLISRTSFSAVASQNFEGVFTSTYAAYRIVVEEIFSVAATGQLQLSLLYSTNTEQTATYYGQQADSIYNSTAWTFQNTNNAAQMELTRTVSGDTAERLSMVIDMFGVGNTSEFPRWNGWHAPSQSPRATVFMGGNITARTYTGFKLKQSAGSNISGTIAIYGWAKA